MTLRTGKGSVRTRVETALRVRKLYSADEKDGAVMKTCGVGGRGKSGDVGSDRAGSREVAVSLAPK